VAAEKAFYPVRLLCRCLAVSRAGYYAWRKRCVSQRAREDAQLSVEIRVSHAESRRAYGSPRILRDLRDLGRRVSRKRVARLMRELGLVGRRRRRFKATTDSKHPFPIAANVLMRDFEVSAPNTVWVTDITYVATAEGWLYLAVILDLFSRRVVGFALGDRITRELVLEALRRALAKRPGVRDLIHHSDRGSQLGFKRWSQHLEVRSCDGEGKASSIGPRSASTDEVTRPATGRPARASPAVLGRDRSRLVERGGWSGRGAVSRCRDTMVSREWRDAAVYARRLVGALPIVRRERRSRSSQGPRLRSARDRVAARPIPVDDFSRAAPECRNA
jgi:hypothetical protein